MSVGRALHALGLRARLGPGGSSSGVFRYVQPEPIEYRFDGAGIDRDGSLVLIEEETGPISSLHIYGHLARLEVMSVLGDPVDEIAWVVRPEKLAELKRITRPWYKLAPRFSRVPTPRPVYLSPEGKVL